MIELVLRKRVNLNEEMFYEIKLWKLLKSEEYPEGVKYSMVLVDCGEAVLRYDNEKFKGHHKHFKSREIKIQFNGIKKLLKMFYEDIEKYKKGEL